jgi:DNA polymerase-3 subunit gamma/tau
MAAHLRKICQHDHITIDDDALDIIARRAEGALRDAEGLLDQLIAYAGTDIPLDAVREVLGILPREIIERTTEIIADHDFAAALPHLSQLADGGIDYRELLRSLQHYWMELLFLKVGEQSVTEKEREISKELADKFSPEDLLRLVKLASETEPELRRSPNPRTRFEVSFLRWIGLDRSVQIADILTKLQRASSSSSSQSAAKPNEPLVTTTTLPDEPSASTKPPEEKIKPPAKDAPKKSSKEKPSTNKTGENIIDIFMDRFGGEILEVKDTPKTSPRKK